ncbi:hypothetical protein CCACVL1_31071, partial [Corchorus capsularis]
FVAEGLVSVYLLRVAFDFTSE